LGGWGGWNKMTSDESIERIERIIKSEERISKEEIGKIYNELNGELVKKIIIIQRFQGGINGHLGTIGEDITSVPEDKREREWYVSTMKKNIEVLKREAREVTEAIQAQWRIIELMNKITMRAITVEEEVRKPETVVISEQVAHFAEQNVPQVKCRFGCKECDGEGEKYCMECMECKIRRGVEMSQRKLEIKRDQRERMRPQYAMQNADAVKWDQYYFITLTATGEDGSENHIVNELLRSYQRMMPQCTRPKTNAYVIEYTGNGIPHLHGIIRYEGYPKPYKMCPSSSIFKNKIQSQGTKVQNERRSVIEKLTKYGGKEYKTEVVVIREKYEYMRKYGEVRGATVEQLIN
jgi:hypothetical protein